MSEGEGFGQETPEGQGQQSRGKRDLRAQAEMAWARVQQVTQRRPRPEIPTRQLLDAIDRTSTENYLAGIAASLVASSWIHTTGHRTIASLVGIGAPLLIGAGLYLKIVRQTRPGSMEG